MSLLEWSWDTVASGASPAVKGMASWVTLESYQSLAEKYLEENESLDDAVHQLIRWQAGQAGAVGVVNGFPGLLMAGITIPVDIAGVTFIQIRMIAAIAKMNGHDINSPEVRTIGLCALMGAAATETVAAVASTIAMKVANNAVAAIPGRVLVEINKMIGMRLLTKYGTTGIIRFSTLVPVAGAIFGGAINAYGTYYVGLAAHSLFRKTPIEVRISTEEQIGAENEV